MTYTFYPELAWDNNNSSQEMEPFEASSIKEALEKTNELIQSDSEATWAEDLYLTVSDENGNELFNFGYNTKYRDSTIVVEEKLLMKKLGNELKRLFKQ